MGVIRKQSIQTSIISYLGFGLGYVNVLLLFPVLFKPEEFGLTRVLISVVGIASQFAMFGLANTIVRFFPRFKEGDEQNHHGFLGYALKWAGIGILVVGLLLWLLQPWVVEYKREGSELFSDYYFLLFPFLIFEVLYQVFANYTRAIYHSVVNVFFKELFVRLTTLVLIVCFYFGWLDVYQFMWLFVLQYALIAAGLAIYLKMVGQFGIRVDREFLSPELVKEIANYRVFSAITNASAFMLLSIDTVMIGLMIGLGDTAFYSVSFYMAALITIPRNAITNISLPVISDAWKRNDMKLIEEVYSKTSKNQLLLGMLIFIGIWANEANIFEMLPKEYAQGKWVLFFAGMAKLIEGAFGLNGGIIVTSKLYRFDTYSNLLLLVITIILNLIFIPWMGIIGAAIATAISITTFNFAKYIFLRVKFGFEPFDAKSGMIVLLGAACYAISLLLPQLPNTYVDIALRSAIITAIFVPTALVLKLSDDVNSFLKTIVQRITNR